MDKVIKGFKVFNPDWTCNPNGKPFQYEVGKTYEEDVKPMVCDRGFHFCEKAAWYVNEEIKQYEGMDDE